MEFFWNSADPVTLHTEVAQFARDGVPAGNVPACVVRSMETAAQIASIEASTLRAPEGLHDDRADAFALAVAGVAWIGGGCWVSGKQSCPR